MALEDRIERFEEMFGYHLSNCERALEVNSLDAAERSFSKAAQTASILTELRHQKSREDQRGA